MLFDHIPETYLEEICTWLEHTKLREPFERAWAQVCCGDQPKEAWDEISGRLSEVFVEPGDEADAVLGKSVEFAQTAVGAEAVNFWDCFMVLIRKHNVVVMAVVEEAAVSNTQ